MRKRHLNILWLIVFSIYFSTNTYAQNTITLQPSNVNSNPPSSYIIGAQRNHIFAQVREAGSTTNFTPWFNELMNRYNQVQPNFGNGKKIYRLGGNQIDGQIGTLKETTFQNPSNQTIYEEVINACYSQIDQISEVRLIDPNNSNSDEYRFYADPNDANGTNDEFIYIENADYKGFHWQDMIGQVSNNTGGLEKFGQYDDIKYYVAEAVAMDADLTVTVNFSSGPPSEAVGLIDRIKGELGGDITRLKYVELGNEVSEPYIKGNRRYYGVDENGDCQVYESKSKNRAEYGKNAIEFADELRTWLDNNNGSHVKIGIVGTTNSYWAWNDPSPVPNEKLDALLNATHPSSSLPGFLADYIDFVIYHGYPSYPIINPADEYSCCLTNPSTGQQYSDEELAKLILAQNPWNIEKRIGEQKTIISNSSNPNITIANTEYYSHLNSQARPNLVFSITDALFTADNMVTALNEDMEMAVNFAFYHWQIDQGTVSDNLFFYLDQNDVVTGNKPSFEVQKLVASELGDKIISSSDNFSSVSNYDIDVSNLARWPWDTESNFSYKPLSYVTTIKPDGTLVVLIVNRSDQAIPLSVQNTEMNSPIASIKSIVGNAYNDQSPTIPTSFSSIPSLSNMSIPGLSISILKIQEDASSNPITFTSCPSDISVTTNDVVNWSSPTATTTCVVPGGCTTPPAINGYTMLGTFGSSNYYLSVGEGSWETVRDLCIQENGNLVDFNSEEEYNFVKNEISHLSEKIWFGAYQGNTSTWQWVTGELFDYTNWDGGSAPTTMNHAGVLIPWSTPTSYLWDGQTKTAWDKYLLEVPCNGSGSGPANVTISAPTVTDQNNNPVNFTPGQSWPAGIYTVTYSGSDPCLNSEFCSFTVTVNNAIATCFDNIQNQGETDVDCGGPNCPECPEGGCTTYTSSCNNALTVEGCDGLIKITINVPNISYVKIKRFTPSFQQWLVCSTWTNPCNVNDVLDTPLSAGTYEVSYKLNGVKCIIDNVIVQSSQSLPITPDNNNLTENIKPSTKEESSLDFSIYPNPAKEKLYVSLSDFYEQKGTLKIINSFGATIHEFDLKKTTKKTISFDLNKYSSGIYFIQLNIEGKQNLTRKFIVNK